MANYTYPQSIVEGLSGTTLLTRLEANLGQPTTPTAGSLQAWLNADAVGSRNLARTNFAWYAGFQSGQFAAGGLTSPTVADASTQRAVDTRCLGTLTITAGALNTNSVSQRVLALGRKGGDVTVMQTDAPKMGMLRGHGLVTINAGDSSGTAVIDWDSGTTPTVAEQRPSTWTNNLSNIHVVTCITDETAVEDDPTTPTAMHCLSTTGYGNTGFTARAAYYADSGGWSIAVAPATVTIGFEWRGFVEHA